MMTDNQGSVPSENNASNEPGNTQPVAGSPKQSTEGQGGAPPPLVVKRVKGAKSKTVDLSRGLSSARIEFERVRGNRKPWRVTWKEGGEERSEMYATYDEAYAAAEAKVNFLAEGHRTLTKNEFEDLVKFKFRIEQLELRLAPEKKTLDDIVADVLAATAELPGWTATQMAHFIKCHHGVNNPMLVADVASKFCEYLKGGYEREYCGPYLDYADLTFSRFVAAFPGRWFHTLTPEDMITYINNYRVTPRTLEDQKRADANGMVEAERKSKNKLHNLLRRLFDYGKDVLEALPRGLMTAMAMLKAPEYNKKTPETYTYVQVVQLYSVMPDLESVLFISLQLYAGLRPCECERVLKSDIKRGLDGKLSHIYIRPEVGKKSPKQETRVRTRNAPITPPLAALLESMDLAEGPLFRSKNIRTRVVKAAKAGGFVWKHDGLRHTFVTFRLALKKNRGEVALEAGHGVDVQIAHYDGLLDELADVPKYWDFVIPCNLPPCLNPLVVGMKFVVDYKKAQVKARKIIQLPNAA